MGGPVGADLPKHWDRVALSWYGQRHIVTGLTLDDVTLGYTGNTRSAATHWFCSCFRPQVKHNQTILFRKKV